MDCQNIEVLIFDFLTNRISLSQSEVLKNHLRNCSKCRDKVAESKFLLKTLNIIKPARLPDDFSQQVMAGIIAREKTESVEQRSPRNIIQMLTGLFNKLTYPAPAFVTALLVVGLVSIFYQQESDLSPGEPILKQNEIHIPTTIQINVTDIDLGLKKINAAVKHARGVVEYQEALGPDTWRLDIQIAPQLKGTLVDSLKDQGLIFNEKIVPNNDEIVTIILSVRKK